LTVPPVREHQATHCLTQLRHSMMHMVFSMPSTLPPLFACAKRGGEALALPTAWLPLERIHRTGTGKGNGTGNGSEAKSARSGVGFHLHGRLLVWSFTSVPTARGFVRPLRTVSSADPTRWGGSRPLHRVASLRAHTQDRDGEGERDRERV